MTYTVVGSAKTRAFRVVWMLEEIGLAYNHIPEFPGSDAVRAHNPQGKIPVLLVDDHAVTDSVAILQFLADRHGALTAPAGSLDRARQDAMTHFLLDEFDAVLWTAARHSFVLPEEKRVPEVKPSLKWEFERSLKVLIERMGDGPFVMGAEMSVPDILLTHCAGWAERAEFPLDAPALTDYLGRMRSRPAFQKALAAQSA